MKTHLAVVSLLVAVAAGCSSTPSEEGAPVASEQGDTVTQTLVTLHPDGTQTEIVRTLTRAESAAEGERLMRKHAQLAANPEMDEEKALGGGVHAIAVTGRYEPNCDNYDTVIYDQYNWSGNSTCYTGSGTVDLSRACRGWISSGFRRMCIGFWSGAVRSWLGGYRSGTWNGPAEDYCPSTFTQFNYSAAAPSFACAYNSTSLTLAQAW